MFRTLKASEIECRVSTVSEKGLSLLLYKDARVDMNMLDEVVGSFNWKREHSRDNANCTVSIWDEEKSQWISKEDTGAESFTEKEKGLASDSFKRACFNWGIGRELYTAPFVWIASANTEITPKRDGKGFTTYDKFIVGTIGYDDDKNIIALTINNAKTGKEVYSFGGKPKPKAEPKAEVKPTATKPQEPMQSKYITVEQCVDVNDIFSEHGWDLKKAMKERWKINTLGEMTVEMYQAVLKQAAK